MRLRSLLFVPADSERKILKASDCAADGLIFDLEDSVAPACKTEARERVRRLLGERASITQSFWVRVNALDTGLMLADLAAVVRPGLDGLVLPKINGAHELDRIGHYLDALEATTGMPAGGVRMVVVATETPAAMFNLGGYSPAHPRLAGLTWGAEDLSSAIGAATNKDEAGDWSSPYRLARNLCLFAAAAAGVAALDTLYADFRDRNGLAAACRASRRDGFTGRLAIHPGQVETINACFTPGEADIAHARAVVAAFAAAPEAGVVGIDGKMYDIPHLNGARRLLAAAGEDQ